MPSFASWNSPPNAFILTPSLTASGNYTLVFNISDTVNNVPYSFPIEVLPNAPAIFSPAMVD